MAEAIDFDSLRKPKRAKKKRGAEESKKETV
jgi:hypothetical protein